MVRGSSVDGFNLVPDWLGEGFVSLSASQLAQPDPDADYDELRQAVETAYQHKSYAYRDSGWRNSTGSCAGCVPVTWC